MENNQQSTKGYLVSSIIGEGARFTGDVDLAGLLRIDGDLIGTVRNDDRVLVGRTGRIQGSLYSDTIIVGGVVKGELYARSKVVLLSSGVVLGNIYTAHLVVEKNALFDGKGIISENDKDHDRDSITSGVFKLNWNQLDTQSKSSLVAGRM